MDTHMIGTREAWLDRAPKGRNETGYAGTIILKHLLDLASWGRDAPSWIVDGDKLLGMAESAVARKLPDGANQSVAQNPA